MKTIEHYDIKIFTDNIEQEAIDQINSLLKVGVFEDCKIRIMPDVHSGAGCVIGFTSEMKDKVISNIVGVDLGCGVLVHKLSEKPDSQHLQDIIEAYIPFGCEVRKDWINIKPAYQKYRKKASELLEKLHCLKELRNPGRLADSVGSLGSGNHYIEIDKDSADNYYLVIHSGSRNLGKQVAEYYQNLAIKTLAGNTKEELKAAEKELTKRYKESGRKKEISQALRKLKEEFEKKNPTIPKDLCWLEGENMESYLHDVKVCQEFAHLNRELMALIILDKLGLESIESFETIHNYIDLKTRIIRKGAVSAKEGEKLIIPMNMRDGALICIGKGNSDWNCSAPHGAGRLMSRSKARQLLDLDEVKKSMKGIDTWSLDFKTIDEAPQAYKPMEEIIENIKDTVEIIEVIKPVYNFKASE